MEEDFFHRFWCPWDLFPIRSYCYSHGIPNDFSNLFDVFLLNIHLPRRFDVEMIFITELCWQWRQILDIHFKIHALVHIWIHKVAKSNPKICLYLNLKLMRWHSVRFCSFYVYLSNFYFCETGKKCAKSFLSTSHTARLKSDSMYKLTEQNVKFPFVTDAKHVLTSKFIEFMSTPSTSQRLIKQRREMGFVADWKWNACPSPTKKYIYFHI